MPLLVMLQTWLPTVRLIWVSREGCTSPSCRCAQMVYSCLENWNCRLIPSCVCVCVCVCVRCELLGGSGRGANVLQPLCSRAGGDGCRHANSSGGPHCLSGQLAMVVCLRGHHPESAQLYHVSTRTQYSVFFRTNFGLLVAL